MATTATVAITVVEGWLMGVRGVRRVRGVRVNHLRMFFSATGSKGESQGENKGESLVIWSNPFPHVSGHARLWVS